MAVNLHRDCIARLIEFVAENLEKVQVNNKVFLNFDSILNLVGSDKILPEKGTVRDSLNKFVIEELPLFYFLYESIGRDIDENGIYDSDAKESFLKELPRYGDLKVKAKLLIEEFNSLPWNYLISYELNASIGQQLRQIMGDYNFSENLILSCPTLNYDQIYPLQSGIKQRDEEFFREHRPGLGLRAGIADLPDYVSKPLNKWNQTTAYLQVKTEGFIGQYVKTKPVEEAIATLKSFFGLSLAVRLMKIKEVPLGLSGLYWARPQLESRIIVHRMIEDKWQVWTTYALPMDLSETLNKLAIDDLDGSLDTSQIGNWINQRILLISSAFENERKSEWLLLAGQWLLDSYIGKNELLSFVQTTVAMEILLGDKSKSDIIGIGELLRNRCAYLIGKSHSQRASILEDFNRIYTVRSDIVHKGKSRLNSEEKRLFNKLQWMCRRVIEEELNLLVEDKKKHIKLKEAIS